jgi:hypothetical protein
MAQNGKNDERPAVVVSQGEGLGDYLTVEEGLARLATLSQDIPIEDWAESEVLDVEALAHRFGVSVAEIAKWQMEQRILALINGGDIEVYPIRQFEGNLPIDGLAAVRVHFGCDETTWEWLIGPNRYTGGEYPLEWLRKGHIQDVVSAAEGACDYQ